MKRILFMGDSPTFNTGFAYVLKNLLSYLYKTQKFDIHCIGWHYQGEPYNRQEIPYPIYPSKPYGVVELKYWIDKLNPDIIFTLADLFMIRDIPKVLNSIKKYVRPKWVAYFPVDSNPIHTDDKMILKYIDYPITYSEFGVKSCQELVNNILVENIPHGIDCNKYISINKKDIKKIQGFNGKFVVGFVGTNQDRKQPYRLIETFKKFTCKYYNEVEKCKFCNGHCKKYENCKPEAVLYLHTQIFSKRDDMTYSGYDMYELLNRYKIERQVWNTPDIDYVKGLSEIAYITLLNCFNVLWMGTQGEGCGIPTMEASALGIPVLSTNYSANEYNPDINNLIDVETYIIDRNLSSRRAICSINHSVELLNKYYDRWCKNGDEIFNEYKQYILDKFDLSCILNKWLNFFSQL